MAKTRRQSGLGSGKRQRSQLPAGVLWLASYLARRAPLTSLESHQMPSICGLDPDWQETCDHRQGVFSALEAGSVRRAQHHQAAPAICGVPGMMLSAPRSYPEGPQSPHGDLPKGRGESKVQQARKPL